MGIAALILGILSIIIGFIPLCGSIALLPAIIGLILGIIDTVVKSKKGEKKGVSIAGLILSALAIIIIVFWVFVFGMIVQNIDTNQILEDAMEAQNSFYYNAQVQEEQLQDAMDWLQSQYGEQYN